MPAIRTNSYTVMVVDDAEHLAAELTQEEVFDDAAWTYTAVPADHAKNGGARPGTCQPGVKQAIANGEAVYTVAVHDEDGEFMGYL